MSTFNVWKSFDKINKTEAKCRYKECGAIIKLVNYSTSTLRYHVLHHESLTRRSLSPSTSRENRPMILAKLAAKDGIAISKIITSDASKSYLASRHFQMPLTRTIIWEEIARYHRQVLLNLQQFVHQSKVQHRKFCLIINEWTDVQNKRYLQIKLHNGVNSMQYSIASIGKWGKCDDIKLLSIFTHKLKAINLNIKSDIVASIHGGFSVLGHLLPFENQLCFNYGINSAVLEVFFIKIEDYYDSDEEDDEEDDDEDDSLDDVLQIDEPESLPMKSVYHDIIQTVRNYFRIFQKSPLKFAKLKLNLGKDVTLIVNCKTKWNSILQMLEQFDDLKVVIKSTMLELDDDYDDNIEVKIFEIIECLRPVQEAMKKLSSPACNLLIAEAICIYLLTALEKLNTKVGFNLFNSMKMHIEECRNVELISTMIFLHSGKYPQDNQRFKYANKQTIKNKINELHARLISTGEIYETPTSTNESNLNQTIDQFLRKNISMIIDNDIKVFEWTKIRSEKLENIWGALETIQASSTEEERTFSVSRNMGKTNIRSRLSEEHLDMLVHLKYHFKSHSKSINSI